MITAGVPGAHRGDERQAFILTADGDAEWLSDDIPSILRRPARSYQQFAHDYAPAFPRTAQRRTRRRHDRP